jgi:hypothetical protein
VCLLKLPETTTKVAVNLTEWDNLIRCVSDNSNGCWEITTATFGGYSRPYLEAAWDGDIQRLGDPIFMSPQDASGKQELAKFIASGMLVNRAWQIDNWDIKVKNARDTVESTLTITTN